MGGGRPGHRGGKKRGVRSKVAVDWREDRGLGRRLVADARARAGAATPSSGSSDVEPLPPSEDRGAPAGGSSVPQESPAAPGSSRAGSVAFVEGPRADWAAANDRRALRRFAVLMADPRAASDDDEQQQAAPPHGPARLEPAGSPAASSGGLEVRTTGPPPVPPLREPAGSPAASLGCGCSPGWEASAPSSPGERAAAPWTWPGKGGGLPWRRGSCQPSDPADAAPVVADTERRVPRQENAGPWQ